MMKNKTKKQKNDDGCGSIFDRWVVCVCVFWQGLGPVGPDRSFAVEKSVALFAGWVFRYFRARLKSGAILIESLATFCSHLFLFRWMI